MIFINLGTIENCKKILYIVVLAIPILL